MLKKICSNPIINSFIKQNKLSFSEPIRRPPISQEEFEKIRTDLIKKQNNDFDEITVRKRPTRLPLTNTEVKKTSDFYDQKKGPIRETEAVFNFNEPALNNKP